MDIGFHNCVARALLVHVSAEENIRRSLQVIHSAVDSLRPINVTSAGDWNHTAVKDLLCLSTEPVND